MSATSSTTVDARRAPPRARGVRLGIAERAPARPWRLLVAACLALGALSLLLPSEPTYDPWAWIIWGREITEWNLVTTAGPSWKPLPVLFTVPFALAGDDVAPQLWLVIARAGGLLAIAMAFRLGARMAGPAAGAIAAVALALADEFVRNFARGNSEGILVAVCLWAVERHLDGRRTDAFLLGLAAALLRPEVWPFFGLYGLWLAWREPRLRLFVGGAFALTGALWLVPEYLGSGDFLRAASRARQANADSAAFADRPFLEVFDRSSGVLALPVLLGAVVALVAEWRAWRRRGRPGTLAVLAAAAAVLMVAVALMTEAGFAGNLRYVALPAAFVCVLAGAGWVAVVRAVSARGGAAAAAATAFVLIAAATPFIVVAAGSFRDDLHAINSEADFYADAERAIAIAGGRAATLACGRIFTGPFQVQAIAYRLHVHGRQVGIPRQARPPGTVFSPRHSALGMEEGFPKIGETTKWIVRRSCAQ